MQIRDLTLVSEWLTIAAGVPRIHTETKLAVKYQLLVMNRSISINDRFDAKTRRVLHGKRSVDQTFLSP